MTCARHFVGKATDVGTISLLPVGVHVDNQINAAGEAQITGFQMAGELLGMDAISADRHHCDAVALEDSEVCEIPFVHLQDLFGQVPALLRHVHRIMSQEITREQNVMRLLGNMRAEQRFAVFLINLSARYAARLFVHALPVAHVARRHRQLPGPDHRKHQPPAVPLQEAGAVQPDGLIFR